MPRRSERRYMDTFRDTACEACGQNDGTVVPAHCNMGLGGMGYRAPGVIAGLCYRCHAIADGRTSEPYTERLKIWVRVAQKLMGDRFKEFAG